jgi:hypothetical protein
MERNDMGSQGYKWKGKERNVNTRICMERKGMERHDMERYGNI